MEETKFEYKTKIMSLNLDEFQACMYALQYVLYRETEVGFSENNCKSALDKIQDMFEEIGEEIDS